MSTFRFTRYTNLSLGKSPDMPVCKLIQQAGYVSKPSWYAFRYPADTQLR